MTKKILFCLLLFVLFAACKKEKKPVSATYSVIGNWSLYSYQTNFGIGVNASVAQYPCMGYNTFTFYNDHTSSESYSGIDTCFITATHAQGAQYYGLPGLAPLPSTWSQSGNKLLLTYPGNAKSIYGVVANVNGKLQITFKDTVTRGASTYYIALVEVKQ